MHIPIGQGRLHVERFGFGDRPVVLLHGFGTSGFLWRRVAPLLPLGRVTAFAVDFLGHGASDRITDADYGVLAQVDYIDAAMGALAIGRADVVGVDVGAAVALALAARRAARVRTLVLVNPPEGMGQMPGASLVQAARLPLKRRSLRGAVLGQPWAMDAGWTEAAVGAVLPGLRLVGTGAVPTGAAFELLGSADGWWVGRNR